MSMKPALSLDQVTLSSLMDSPLFGVLIVDKEGDIRFLSRTIQDQFGYCEEDLLGKGFELLFHDRYRHRRTEFRDSFFSHPGVRKMSAARDLYGRRKDGSEFPVEIGLSAISVDEELYSVATVVDITARKNTEETLALVIESSLLAILIVDDQGIIRFSNRTVLDLFGYNEEELTGRAVEILLPDRHRKTHPTFRNNYLSSPQVRAMGEGRDLSAMRKDGSEFPVEIGLNPVTLHGKQFVIATIIDITKRKEEENARRNVERLLKKTQELGGIGGWELNLESQELCWTDEVRKIHEVPQDFQPTLEKALEFYHADSLPILQRAIDDAIEAGHPWDLELGFRTAKGRDLIVRAQGEVETKGGRVVRLFGTFKDITAARRIEEEERRNEEQLQHAQKLESLGVLAGGIAHDFNNMLLAILGNAELALDTLSPTAPGRENIQDVISTSIRASELCRQMLAYSGRGKFVVQSIDLSELVEEILHLMEIAISKSAVLKLNLARHLPAIDADTSQIRQIIMNLITNASDALGDRSGIITVTTGCMECDEEYLSETYLDQGLTPGYYVFCEVADTGCGMDDAVQSKIFDPFFTTKFTGRGLGMAAVLGILRGHKGGIKVYSEPGRGTTIKVLFPASEKSATPILNLPTHLESWTGSGIALVVDDEETVRTLGKKILEKAGFQVITACDGLEALELFKKHQSEIALVLLDMTMPHMDGVEAFRELRGIRADVKVILSSGYNEQDATSHFAGKGLAGFIQKPYRPIDLVRKIREVFS